MRAAENKRIVLVGIFVLVAIGILVAVIFTLGGQQKRFVKTISLLAVFDNVAGLKTGNNVWFSGVKIGTVKQIKFYGESQVQITMNVEEESQKYIRKDAVARLTSESLIGNKIIEIYGGTTKIPAVQEGDVLKVEEALNTEDMMETLQENNKNLVSVTRDFKVLSNRLVKGQGTIGKLLSDSTMAETFRATVNNLQQASATTARASTALLQFSSRLNNKDGLVNTLLTDTAVFSQLETAISQLDKATAAAAQMTENLNKTSKKLDTPNNAIGVLLNDEKFATQLQSAMVNLDKSSSSLNDNLEAIKTNFLLKGYFKRKAIKDARERDRLEKVKSGNQSPLPVNK